MPRTELYNAETHSLSDDARNNSHLATMRDKTQQTRNVQQAYTTTSARCTQQSQHTALNTGAEQLVKVHDICPAPRKGFLTRQYILVILFTADRMIETSRDNLFVICHKMKASLVSVLTSQRERNESIVLFSLFTYIT